MRAVPLPQLEAAIILPGIEKHLKPLVAYRGNITLGAAHRMLNLVISGMEHDCSMSDMTQRLQQNADYSQLCLPEKTKANMAICSFLSRLEANPKVANNIPHLLDYSRSLGGFRAHLTRVSLTTGRRRNMGAGGWRTFKSSPSAIQKAREPREAINYPFLIHDGGKPEHDMLKRVNAAVPKWLPPDRRADICQDLIVGILSGELSMDDLALPTKEMTKQVLRKFPTKYGDMSLDATIGDTDMRLIDMLSEEDSIWNRI